MPSFYPFILIMSLAGAVITADSPATSQAQTMSTPRDTVAGYSALKLFLEDERHLTIIRQTKLIITFSAISDRSEKLVDDIASTSTQALEELEKLSRAKPAFDFINFSDETIAKATIDSLRMTTAKEFLFAGDEFEKDLLLSQLKILPVISHLSRQLKEKETNDKRKAWLNKLAQRYENFYQQANAGIAISPGT